MAHDLAQSHDGFKVSADAVLTWCLRAVEVELNGREKCITCWACSW